MTQPPLKDETVGQIQRKLKEPGIDPGPLDDTYGRLTRDAVKAFQQSRGFFVNGEVGVQTAAALGLTLPVLE